MSHLRTNRAVAALAVGAALVLGTAACGVSASTDKVATGPTSAAEGARFLSGAAARTSKVTSERFSMTSTITAMGMDVTTTAEGAIDLAAKRGHITTTVSGGPEAVDGAMEVVVDGTTGYLSGEAFSMFLPKGKTWLKLDASSLAGKGGLGRELPGAGSATTDLDGAGSFLDLLTETGDTVTTVGTEDVRGTSTTHVRTRIQLDKVLAKAPEAKRKRIEKVITQLGSKADAITELPIDAWVDQDGYVLDLGANRFEGKGNRIFCPVKEQHRYGREFLERFRDINFPRVEAKKRRNEISQWCEDDLKRLSTDESPPAENSL